MPTALDRVSIQGFRSIRDLQGLKLDRLNVLVGANGAGKSNFVDFFRLLRAMAMEGLQKFVAESGGADSMCFDGPKVTSAIKAHLEFGKNEYRFELKPQVNGVMTVMAEEIRYERVYPFTQHREPQKESRLKNWVGNLSSYFRDKGYDDYLSTEGHIAQAVNGWVVYHVHDTSRTASMRRMHSVANHRELEPDAGNIAPFLRKMRVQHEPHYRRVCDTIRLVAPFFDDFILDEETQGPSEQTKLEWRQKGSSFPYQPWQLSDGTIRFVCLATALLQPAPPSTIIIDEPELGLHPFALETLAGLIHEASEKTQVIVSTQSPLLLNRFSPEQVIVVDRENGASRFQRLDGNSLSAWLEEYAVGELLLKNVIETSPRHEP